MLRETLPSPRQAGSSPRATPPAANEIDALRERYAFYMRLGKRKAAMAVHLRMAELIERQLRKEIKADAAKSKTGRALRDSVNLQRIGL